jgi:hypothetical protein
MDAAAKMKAAQKHSSLDDVKSNKTINGMEAMRSNVRMLGRFSI